MLRILCKRYKIRHRLWSKRKDQLIDDLLAHADDLLAGFGGTADESLAKGQAVLQAGQAELKDHVSAERKALETFLEAKLRVSRGDRLVNHWGSWASILALLLAIAVLVWPKSPEAYHLTVYLLDEDGGAIAEATVDAQAWSAEKEDDHWSVTIPLDKVPEDKKVHLTAQRDQARAEETVTLSTERRFSVTLVLREPNARIFGVVYHPDGNPLGGVRVSVWGHEREAVTTAADGTFSLPAHVPKGEAVRVTAQKGNLRSVSRRTAGNHHEIHLIDRSEP